MPLSNSLIYLRDNLFGEFLEEREGLTELAVNRPNQIYTKEKGKWIEHSVNLSYNECFDFLSPLANYNANHVGVESPILSATLHTGERVQGILPPACEKDTISITIRKPSNVFISHEYFVEQGFYSRLNKIDGVKKTNNKLLALFQSNNMAEFIPECLRQGKTMVFCGGTGSGKTTFGNAVLFYIPHSLRILTIEDTDETKLRFHDNHVKLYYPPEAGDNAIITPAKLLRSGYRMNPDRILMTEVRGAETWDFIKGISSGHAGGVTTVHEDNPEDAIIGLITRCYQNPECNNLPYNVILRKILSNIDVIMSIKYLDDEDSRFATGIYFKDLHRDKYLSNLKGQF